MIKDSINRLVEETAAEMGYEIYEQSLLIRGEHSQVVVKLDKLDGISHQDCEKFSNALSAKLDDQQLFPNYSLEISSPGLQRMIRSLEEFKRFVAAPVKVVYNAAHGVEVIKGKIVEIIDENIVLQEERRKITIAYSSVINANLDY